MSCYQNLQPRKQDRNVLVLECCIINYSLQETHNVLQADDIALLLDQVIDQAKVTASFLYIQTTNAAFLIEMAKFRI